MGKKKKKVFRTGLFIIGFLIISFAGFYLYDLYKKVYAPNVKEHSGLEHYLYIPSDADFNKVLSILIQRDILIDKNSFVWVAEKMNYAANIHPGRYFVEPGTNNRKLVALLRSGTQKPVRLYIGKYRDKAKLVKYVTSKIEADSTVLLDLLNDKIYLRQYGLNSEIVLSIFISNTYELYWNTSATDFFERMVKEYKRFWTPGRLEKAEALGLTPLEVIILASIVDEETYVTSEKSVIAGVYLNRLKKGMRLQADPTVRYALQDFDIRRVLKKHTQFESPYNTYRNKGLPPGPICVVSPTSIDAVLNSKNHNFYYFCASPDFSGYHKFACTYKEHLQNARNYQKILNQKKIR